MIDDMNSSQSNRNRPPGADTGADDDERCTAGVDYREAVECLIQCEDIITALQEQVSDKDDRIAALEERLVEMSLELAKAKAAQDERSLQYTPYRRSLSTADQDHDEYPSGAETSLSTSWTSLLDDSASSRLSANFNRVFRRSKSGAADPPTHRRGRAGRRASAPVRESSDEDEDRPRRRPPNPRRLELMQEVQRSSRSIILEAGGVVFPSSFEDAVGRGLELRGSLIPVKKC